MDGELLMNLMGLRSLESQIGVMFEGCFLIESTVLDGLAVIEKGLTDTNSLHSYRCQLVKSELFKNCLVPLIIDLDSEENEFVDDKEEIFSHTIKILSLLCEPLDYSQITTKTSADQPQRTDEQRYSDPDESHKSIQNSAIAAVTAEFIASQLVAVIMKKINHAILGNKWSDADIDLVNSVLFLFRNLLYNTGDRLVCTTGGNNDSADFMDVVTTGEDDYQHVMLLDLLFENGLKELVIFCANAPQREKWTLSLIQLVTMIYKDSEFSLRSRTFLLNADDEAEKQAEAQCDSVYSDCSSSTMGTFDGGGHDYDSLHVEMHSTKSENSLDSYDDENKNRLQVIIVREKVRDFTLSLLNNGWPQLLYDVKALLVMRNTHNLSPVYYLWNVSFCLMIAQRYCVPFSQVSDILSQYIVDYLVYTAVTCAETLILAKQTDTTQHLADTVLLLDLAVTGIKYMMKCVQCYWLSEHTTQEQHLQLLHTKCVFAQLQDLRQVFVLLLRLYDPNLFSLKYLVSLVTANHSYLIMSDKLKDVNTGYCYFDMRKQIENFADKKLMLTYNVILENVSVCPLVSVGNVITMYDHVVRDLGQTDPVLQLPILQALSALDDSPVADKLPEIFPDLLEMLFDQFLSQAQDDPVILAKKLAESLSSQSTVSLQADSQEGQPNQCEDRTQQDHNKSKKAQVSDWSIEELDELSQLTLQFENSVNFIDNITTSLHNIGIDRSYNEISEQVKMMENLQLTSMDVRQVEQECTIDELISELTAGGKQGYIQWLQNILLHTVYVKIGGMSLGKPYPEEPVIMHSVAFHQAIPLVTYTNHQQAALKDPGFLSLLKSLEIQSPQAGKHAYHRIPYHWGIQEIMSKAKCLGQINYTGLMFNEEDLDAYIKKNECYTTDSVYRNPHCEPDKASVPNASPDLWLFYTNNMKEGDRNKTPANISKQEQEHFVNNKIENNYSVWQMNEKNSESGTDDSVKSVSSLPWWQKPNLGNSYTFIVN